jgi:hypothetical protein
VTRGILSKIVLAVLLSGCVEVSEGGVQGKPDGSVARPTTCQAAITSIVTRLSSEDKAALRKNKKEDLIQYHHGWGTGIRNDFGLWGGNEALARDCAARFGDPSGPEALHPDTISGLIIEQVWRAVGGT